MNGFPAKAQGWFNGYYDNASQRVEGPTPKPRMTLTGQVFPILSGVATDEQVEACFRSAKRNILQDKKWSGFRLNSRISATHAAAARPGVFYFAYGEKENGAFFSHMAVMFAYAALLPRVCQGRR